MLRRLALLGWMIGLTAMAFAGSVTGTLQGASGLPIRNATLNFSLQQAGLLVGTGLVVPATASCYTSSDGSVVGLPNPAGMPVAAINYGSGSMAAGVYYVEYALIDNSGNITLPSPELQVQLTSAGTLTVSPPVTFPANAVGMQVFVGTASGAETAQGNTSGSTQVWTQNVTPAVTTFALPVSNTTVCSIAFNDTILPFSGYNVSLISANGNAYPGWPQTWQLNGGLNGTVNVANGAPLWNGTVVYPMPILAQPLNHGPQSISGPLNFAGYNVVNAGAVGIGTATPGWALDVHGFVNSVNGYLFNGGSGGYGQCLVSNGTAFIPGSCGGALPALNYQFVASNGTVAPQESILDFQPRFTVLDNPGAHWNYVDLAASGVAAGSYSNPTLTVDGYGRVVSASNGVSPAVAQSLVINTGICTTASGAYGTCSFTFHWPNAGLFADGNYTVVCQAVGIPSGGALTGLFASNKTATTVQLTLQTGSASGAGPTTVGEIDCHGSY